MKAFVYDTYGGVEQLRLEEVPTPGPRADWVLLKVHAASINDWDWGLLRGEFTNRVMNGVTRPRRVGIIGSDVAGIVESVGPDVSRFKPGDAVYGDLCMAGFGGFAEYVCRPESCFNLKPDSMSFEEAASIPQAGMLAVQGLIDVGRLSAGQRILINGAGGGVGTFGIQIAKQFEDVEITAVDGAGKLPMLSELGADHVVDYRQQDFTRARKQYDLILDTKTNRSPRDYARVVTPGGTYVTVGGKNLRLLQCFSVGWLYRSVFDRDIRIVALKPNEDISYMNELYEAGKMKPVIDGPFDFNETPDAMRHFISGEHKGKIVITIP